MKKKVVVGLSGGVDSSVAALLLKERGFDVYGLHFAFMEEKHPEKIEKLSEQLKIPIDILDIAGDFKKVKLHFVDEYLKGRTPSPCTFCNRVIKWQKLVDYADQNQLDFISSGHYIRKIEKDGFHFLQKGLDPVKDQSYFLWELSTEIIKKMINPLGEYTKPEVRELARKYGFEELAEKKESMGVCFLQNNDYRDFIKNYYPEKIKQIKQGNIKDDFGNVIGTHQGYIFYTIGQKRGLDLTSKSAAYVKEINPQKNELIVGSKKSLNKNNIKLHSSHLINPDNLKDNSSVEICVRGYGLNPEEPAIVKRMDSGQIELELSKPAWAVAPGQPVVFYDQDILLGGGIAETSW